MKNYKVYLVRNKDKEIVYCGLTGNSLQKRLQEHRIRRNWDNTYTIELVSEYLTREEAAILERKLIEQYDLLNKGFNKSPDSINSYSNFHSDEQKKKWSLERKGKPIICLETGKIYPSARHAAKELNLQYSKISLVCNGKRETTGGLHFEFYKKR